MKRRHYDMAFAIVLIVYLVLALLFVLAMYR